MSSLKPSATAHSRWPRLVPLVAALVLAGCSLAPRYETPALPVAATWPIPPSGVGILTMAEQAKTPAGEAVPAAAGIGWRQFYHAPDLQRLISLALEHNRDLRIALLNMEAARAQYSIQRADQLPSLGVGANGQRQRVPGDLNASGSALTSSSYQVGLAMPSFEIDLFGRVRNLSEAALAQYLATEEAQRNVQISLIAQVAEAWFNLFATATQARLTERTLESRQASYDLVKARYDAGVGSSLDLNQAETLLDSARSDLIALQRQSLRARNAITQLVGATTIDIADDQALLSNAPLLAQIPVGTPSSVLLARPDVLAAEQQLVAANANIGAARAAFFPSISLTANYGTASAQLSDLFSGGSLAWSFAPQISLPIFTGGVLRAQLNLAEVRRNIAVANYEKTVQQAFREVNDALAGTATYDRQIQAQADLVRAAKRSLDLAQLRYDSGVDSYLQLHDAERTLYSAQQALVQTRLEELLNRVALYKALGGGWLGDTAGPTPSTEEVQPGSHLAAEAHPPTSDLAPTTPSRSAPLPTLATTPAITTEAKPTPPVSDTLAAPRTPADVTTPAASPAPSADPVPVLRTTWRETLRTSDSPR